MTPAAESPPNMLELLVNALRDGFDHPEVWEVVRLLKNDAAQLYHVLTGLIPAQPPGGRLILGALAAVCRAHAGDPRGALKEAEEICAIANQSALVQGAVFHIHSILDPDNPKYRLEGRICPAPFDRLDVLDGASHLCCASYLQASVGNLATTDWRDVWNSPMAQLVRASIFDGTYRYCNKLTCPTIQGNRLVSGAEMAERSEEWSAVIAEKRVAMQRGPLYVTLAYDRTCNLSCPSCRPNRFAADQATRERFEAMQERNIAPLLMDTDIVVITGSGDPFASKNCRKLMESLDAETYPKLKVNLMTNGMLLTPKEWEKFPNLHGRVGALRVSIDAATKETHEALRRGSHWETMLENLAFFSRLRAEKQIDSYEFGFVVQQENYREMGDFVDLARSLGVDKVGFNCVTNWGTFTKEEYTAKAVFLGIHPEHEQFKQALRDPRLKDPIVIINDLRDFVEA